MPDHWNQVDRETRRGAPRVFLIGFLSVIGVLLLISAVLGIKYLTAEPRGRADQREKTVANGNYRIASYDAFFDKCNEIVAKEAIIKSFEDQVKQATTAKEKKDAIINLNAMKNTRIELVQSYNADAQKAGTRALFRSDDLPYQIAIPVNEEVPTKCAA